MSEKIQAPAFLEKAVVPLKTWWQSISARERQLVTICSVLLVVGFLYWGVLQPLTSRTEQAQMRLHSEKQLLQWVSNSANNIVALRSQTGSKGVDRSQPLNKVVYSTASRFQVELIRMQPRDDMLQVWVKPVSFNDLINWIAQLKEQYGVQVLFLDVSRADKDGMVEVNRLQLTRG
ncbi:MAG: type II secretion system protein M [Vibrio sp.]